MTGFPCGLQSKNHKGIYRIYSILSVKQPA